MRTVFYAPRAHESDVTIKWLGKRTSAESMK
jgi:hypothetical protein